MVGHGDRQIDVDSPEDKEDSDGEVTPDRGSTELRTEVGAPSVEHTDASDRATVAGRGEGAAVICCAYVCVCV